MHVIICITIIPSIIMVISIRVGSVIDITVTISNIAVIDVGQVDDPTCSFATFSRNPWVLSPKSEIYISHNTFSGKGSSPATGPRPNACHVTMQAVDNTA